MGRFAQLVLGPAGSGKSTYVAAVANHLKTVGRTAHCVNFDPAAEDFKYDVSIDVRDCVSLDDVVEELDLGPNGGLLYAMEYLSENTEWLQEEIGDYDDDYLIIDCPGQIEIYSHSNVLKNIMDSITNWGFRVCAVYLLDAQFLQDSPRFIAGALSCLSTMVHLEVPHINVLSKMDLIPKKESREVDK
mmetsp:Transcript_10428/g.27329  ORF Transcript_10428/g.27329 Transcript_10428/m.27329 type:complete len:188 (+) Transcript_10428:170-733(+)